MRNLLFYMELNLKREQPPFESDGRRNYDIKTQYTFVPSKVMFQKRTYKQRPSKERFSSKIIISYQ